jgi:hypothetical protein
MGFLFLDDEGDDGSPGPGPGPGGEETLAPMPSPRPARRPAPSASSPSPLLATARALRRTAVPRVPSSPQDPPARSTASAAGPPEPEDGTEAAPQHPFRRRMFGGSTSGESPSRAESKEDAPDTSETGEAPHERKKNN